MKKSKLLSVCLSVLMAVLTITAAVAVPLLCRPFYYAHIQPLGLGKELGLPQEAVIRAYDEVMDYCLGRTDRFSAGIFPFSEEGSAHFADVRKLFLLDLAAVGSCLTVLLLLVLICKRKQWVPYRFAGHGPGFWSATGVGSLLGAVGVFAAVDFERAFVLFHGLFFPGKENWLFSIYQDPVILILPEEFFRNCAILILALVLVWCTVLVAADLINGKRIRSYNTRKR